MLEASKASYLFMWEQALPFQCFGLFHLEKQKAEMTSGYEQAFYWCLGAW